MRRDLKVISLFALLSIVGLTAGLGKFENKISQVKTYPATVCPGTDSGGSAIDLLPNSKVKAAVIPSNLNKMRPIGTSIFNTKKPLLVDGGEVTSVSILKGANGWIAAVNCSISDGDDWFIGGSANVTSKGSLVIVNSGLSPAAVDFKIYSSKPPRTVNKTIDANSVKYVKIDSLAPGEDSIAINAITRAGRVSVFMLDNRGSGLRTLGGDYVAPAPAPSKTVVIPIIPTPKLNAKRSQLLRLVVPGNVDANIKATIFSDDGSFAPRGIDGANINGGTVKDISLKPIVSKSTYSLRIDSDVPLSAAVLTKLGGDFIWSTATSPITQSTLRMGGLKPLLRLYGSDIDVEVSWIDNNKKSGSKRLIGSDTITYRPPNGLTKIKIESLSGSSYGSLLIASGSGYAVLPVVSGSHLESAALPRSDARAINRD